MECPSLQLSVHWGQPRTPTGGCRCPPPHSHGHMPHAAPAHNTKDPHQIQKGREKAQELKHSTVIAGSSAIITDNICTSVINAILLIKKFSYVVLNYGQNIVSNHKYEPSP